MYYPIIRQCIQALTNLETWLDKAEQHADMEAANTANDFSLLCVRMPAKLSDERKSQILATKELHVEPDVVITFPTSLVPSLIRALTTQKENYEKAIGATIQEPGVTK
jgi:hypothetical protein